MTANKPEVKRFDCTSGGSAYCYGCYTMSEDEGGEYVEWEDYEALQAELETVKKVAYGNIELLERNEALQAECEKLRKDAAAALTVLPDSLPMDPYQTVDRSSPHYKAGWNACRRAMLAALRKGAES